MSFLEWRNEQDRIRNRRILGDRRSHRAQAPGRRLQSFRRRTPSRSDGGARRSGATLLSLDLTDDASTIAAVEAIKAQSGRIDVLVNNAGLWLLRRARRRATGGSRDANSKSTYSAWRTFANWCCRRCGRSKSGKIVNITSIGGKIWEPLGSWYHATKFAVEGLSDCLRVEVGRIRHRRHRHRAGSDPHRMGRHRARRLAAGVRRRRICRVGGTPRASSSRQPTRRASLRRPDRRLPRPYYARSNARRPRDPLRRPAAGART